MVTPLAFTPEFRRKVAELSKEDRQDWLASLGARVARAAPSHARDALEAELREVARACRMELVRTIQDQLGPFDPVHLRALLDVPRERFVRADDVAMSAEDTPLPLDDVGLATISAPHIYLLTYRLLGLREGDRLLELGTGSGYGAALASYVVGPSGHVTTVEIDDALVARARENLAPYPNVTLLHGDAVEHAVVASGANKVVVTFAVASIPDSWTRTLPDGGTLVVPVGRESEQRLMRVRRHGDAFDASDHGAVRYVKNRSRR